jgi:hypothetical protein
MPRAPSMHMCTQNTYLHRLYKGQVVFDVSMCPLDTCTCMQDASCIDTHRAPDASCILDAHLRGFNTHIRGFNMHVSRVQHVHSRDQAIKLQASRHAHQGFTPMHSRLNTHVFEGSTFNTHGVEGSTFNACMFEFSAHPQAIFKGSTFDIQRTRAFDGSTHSACLWL